MLTLANLYAFTFSLGAIILCAIHLFIPRVVNPKIVDIALNTSLMAACIMIAMSYVFLYSIIVPVLHQHRPPILIAIVLVVTVVSFAVIGYLISIVVNRNRNRYRNRNRNQNQS